MDARRGREPIGDGIVEQLQREMESLRRECARLGERLRRSEAENQRLRQRLAQYEPEILHEGRAAETDAPAPTNYSVSAEEKRRQARRRRLRREAKRRGRRLTAVKFAAATQIEPVYPPDVPPADCRLDHERAVWRLRDGQAVLVGYRVFRGPDGTVPRIPEVTPRCEYGLEILVVLAFLVYIIGLSLDKAGAVMQFFCGLPLPKSQTEALLRQLAQQWEPEFERLCELVAHAAVVHMDETGWKVGGEGCSLWTFASAGQRVFLFGCRKDAATLDTILPPDVFTGVGVSDDAAVYRDRFVQGQKCWAHLLRKAIRLALLYPRKTKYHRFLDRLLALFYDAKRAAADQRLGAAGRKQRVAELEGRLCELCQPSWREPTPETAPPEREFLNLAQELTDLCLAEELFTFVLRPEVAPTNNLAERLQRGPALDRKAGRTSKTAAGARRRTVLVSVLESLRANLPQFTLTSVVAEVRRWTTAGRSLFAEQWQALTGAPAAAGANTS